MSETLEKIKNLVTAGSYAFSNHAYEKADRADILPREIISGLKSADVVEDYPDAKRGPSVLVAWRNDARRAFHAVWGIPNTNPDIAVLVTVYAPDPAQWTPDFLKRLKP